ncbi:hypothetical protein O181_029857 [Austropuccinia psidii MF-1]|uniref:Retrotransposon gag domain-containing protein n=1 Tax=Austropuccinia psidii MF-1 TaxID=1389203 RepID=A0A9Q3CXE9_9BASI|nr:hypothetical protein [Austropuccinia psidii MF-1]
MPVEHSAPAKQTRSQARAQAALTSTPRVQGEEDDDGEEDCVGEEESDGTEGAPTPVGASQSTGGPALARSYQPVSHQSEPSLLAIMQQMKCFDGTQPFKVRSFLQSCHLIFHNYLANVSQDRKKVLYATSFLIGRAEKWIEPYLSNLTNQDSNYLLNSLPLFESQLFTLFGDLNEFRKAEAELDSLRMKEGGHVSLYTANFRSLVSRIGDWGERALIHHFRKGLPSRIWDQLASHPSRIDYLQELLDFTLELDTRYHEGQKEKNYYKEKKPEAPRSSTSHPQNSSNSSHKKKKFQKRDKPHSSLLNKDFKLMNSEKKEESKRVFVPIVVGSIVLSPVSKGLKTILPNCQANLPARQKPEWRPCCVQWSSQFSFQSTIVHSEYWCQ